MDATGTEATISGLMPSTTYSIQVAAVNSAGTGSYSDAQMPTTLDSEFTYLQNTQADERDNVVFSTVILLLLHVVLYFRV